MKFSKVGMQPTPAFFSCNLGGFALQFKQKSELVRHEEKDRYLIIFDLIFSSSEI